MPSDPCKHPLKNSGTSACKTARKRLRKTPCVKTAYCMDCSSPARICNVWTIHEKSYPKGRIKVILINQDLGL
ncbi:MAG: LUD domain-containing protein [Desulfobacterales bacterium]